MRTFEPLLFWLLTKRTLYDSMKSRMRRKTITIPEEVLFEVEKLRAKRIAENSAISFSEQIVELVKKGLRDIEEERKE